MPKIDAMKEKYEQKKVIVDGESKVRKPRVPKEAKVPKQAKKEVEGVTFDDSFVLCK